MPAEAALAAALRTAKRVAVLTGAGISAESGIPTFRDAMTGLWQDYRPEDLATRAGFRRDPELVWQWYRTRRLAIATAEPNPGHRAVAELGVRVESMVLITQNVDGLHQRAGSREVIELHGNIGRIKCFLCDAPAELFDDTDRLPRCRACGGSLRPDVVWFGELLPAEGLARAQEAARRADVFLSVGTSNLVEPAASLPWLAARHGATVGVINTSHEGQRAGRRIHCLVGPAGTMLPALCRAVWPTALG